MISSVKSNKHQHKRHSHYVIKQRILFALFGGGDQRKTITKCPIKNDISPRFQIELPKKAHFLRKGY